MSWAQKKFKACVFLLAVLPVAFQVRSMAPTITTGDSAELATAQATLGIAHSPGYPLFVLAGKAFSTAMPFGHSAYRANLFSLFCAGATACVLLGLLFQWSGTVLLPAVSILCFLFVPAVQSQFLAAEVFALNMLWLALLGYSFWTALTRLRAEYFYLFSFLFGVGMGNQHTIVLLAPGLLAIASGLILSGRIGARILPPAAFFFALGFSIYIFVPIRSIAGPMLDWEDPENFRRFWNLVTRARYGTLQLAQGVSGSLDFSHLRQGTLFFARLLSNQLGWPGLILFGFGIAAGFYRCRPRFFWYFLAISVLLSGPVFFSLTQGWKQKNPEIVVRFLPQTLMLLFMLTMQGLLRVKRQNYLSALFFAGFCVLFARQSSLAHQWWAFDYGKNILKTAPPDTLLFLDRADEIEFSLAYLKYAGQARTDIRMVDCNAGVTPSIYGDDYYEIWGKPRLARRELKEKELILSSQNPVYYATLESQMIPSIQKIQSGILFSAKPMAGRFPDWDAFYILRGNLSDPGFRGEIFIAGYYELMGKYFLDLGQDSKAERYLAFLPRWLPGQYLYHQAAITAFERQRFDLADRFFSRAYDLEPEKDKILCNWGLVYERIGKAAEAEKIYLRAARLNPESAEPHFKLGSLYWKQGLWEKVEQEFEKTLQIDPSYKDAGRYLEIARARRK